MFPAGSKIEVTIKNDKGEVIDRWYSMNAVPTEHITATFVGGIIVTDNAGNTYTQEPE